jgi:MYXO-CTERM domain-containing protein
MKTLNLVAAVLACAGSLQAQGTVNFASPSGVTITNLRTWAPLVVGTTFSVALYYLPDQATPPTSWDFDASGLALGSHAHIGPVAGVFVGGTRTAPTAPPGGSGWFQVRAWESAFGETYEQAARVTGANFGTSNIFRVDTGDPTTIPPGTPAPLTGLRSFILYVPEPSAWALGALGFVALFFLARRRRGE